jgi:hypothetical protein
VDPCNPDKPSTAGTGTSIVKVDRAAGPPTSSPPAEPGTGSICVPTSPKLEKLAQSIRKELDGVRAGCRTVLACAVRAGEKFAKAKKEVPPRQWCCWVEENCGISDDTARAYMRLAKAVAEGRLDLAAPKQEPAPETTIKAALKMIATPRRKRARIEAKPGTAQVPTAMDPAHPESSCAPADGQQHERHQQDDNHGGDEPLPCELLVPAAEPAAAPPAGLAARPERRETESLPNLGGTMRPDDAQAAGEPGGSTVATSDAIDATEQVRSLPLWTQLPDPSGFERDALLWLSLQRELELIQQKFHPSDDELAAGYAGSWNQKRFSCRVAGLIGIMHPRHWHLCELCKGSGRSNSLDKECDWCRGAGYEPAHRGDRVRRIDTTASPAGTPPAEPAGTPQPAPASTPQPEPATTPQPEPATTPQPAPASTPQPEWWKRKKRDLS